MHLPQLRILFLSVLVKLGQIEGRVFLRHFKEIQGQSEKVNHFQTKLSTDIEKTLLF